MMGKQHETFDKSGLGYKPHQKQKQFENYFVKQDILNHLVMHVENLVIKSMNTV